MNLKRFAHPAALIAIAWTIFQLYTAWAGFYPALVQRSLHVGFAVALCFAVFPTFRRGDRASPMQVADPETAAEPTDHVADAAGTEQPDTPPGRRVWKRFDVALGALMSVLALGTGLYVFVEYDRGGRTRRRRRARSRAPGRSSTRRGRRRIASTRDVPAVYPAAPFRPRPRRGRSARQPSPGRPPASGSPGHRAGTSGTPRSRVRRRTPHARSAGPVRDRTPPTRCRAGRWSKR